MNRALASLRVAGHAKVGQTGNLRMDVLFSFSCISVAVKRVFSFSCISVAVKRGVLGCASESQKLLRTLTNDLPASVDMM